MPSCPMGLDTPLILLILEHGAFYVWVLGFTVLFSIEKTQAIHYTLWVWYNVHAIYLTL